MIQVCLGYCVLEANGGNPGAHLRNGGPSVSGWFSLILHSALDRRKSIPHSARRLARAAAGGGGRWLGTGSVGAPSPVSGAQAGAVMTRGMTRAMRRSADVAGAGVRPRRPQGGTPRHDPKAGARIAHPTSRARARIKGQLGDPRASIASPDLAPDVFFLRVKLEETGELFRVANCRNDMTVRELKEELDLMVGIPFNLQRLQFLDQGGPCPVPSHTSRAPSTQGPRPTPAQGPQNISNYQRSQGDQVNSNHLEPHLERPLGAQATQEPPTPNTQVSQ